MALSPFNADLNIISQLPDRPNDERGLSPQAFKEEFDRAGLLIQEYINTILLEQITNDIKAAVNAGADPDVGISGASIIDGTVTASKLAANSVTTDKIVNDAITADKIAPKAVTEEAVADFSVGERAYKQGSVTSAALAQNSVTADKIVEGAVTGEKLANSSVGTAKIADASVTRTKLARDALYSPMKGTGTATEYYFVADDLGKTVTCTGTAPSGKATYIMTEKVAASLPLGAEIAVAWSNGTGGVQVKFEGNIKSATSGDSGYVAGRTYNIPERYSMIALKMLGNASPTYWLVTGNVEVVE